MNKFLYQGEMKTFTIPLVVDGVAYTPGEEAQIIFTMKRDARLQDSAIGVVQKTKDYGLVVAGTSVLVSLVFADTHDLPPGPYVCEVRVKESDSGWRVAASTVVAVRQGVQQEQEVVQEIHTSEPPIPNQMVGPAGTITIGSVTTGAPGTAALVENVGTSQAAVLNITIPRGNTGADSTVPGPPGTTDYNNLSNKPPAFPPTAHDHTRFHDGFGALLQVGNGYAFNLEGGYNTTAPANYAFAYGHSCTASGDSSVALGRNCTASGQASFAVGMGSVASGVYSIACGRSASATAYYTVALGYRAKANHYGALVLTDSQNADQASSATDQATLRFANGYRFLGGAADFATTPTVGGSALATVAATVPTTRTINGYDLSANRTLTASDVGAATAAQGAKADTALQRGSGAYELQMSFPRVAARLYEMGTTSGAKHLTFFGFGDSLGARVSGSLSESVKSQIGIAGYALGALSYKTLSGTVVHPGANGTPNFQPTIFDTGVVWNMSASSVLAFSMAKGGTDLQPISSAACVVWAAKQPGGGTLSIEYSNDGGTNWITSSLTGSTSISTDGAATEVAEISVTHYESRRRLWRVTATGGPVNFVGAKVFNHLVSGAIVAWTSNGGLRVDQAIQGQSAIRNAIGAALSPAFVTVHFHEGAGEADQTEVSTLVNNWAAAIPVADFCVIAQTAHGGDPSGTNRDLVNSYWQTAISDKPFWSILYPETVIPDAYMTAAGWNDPDSLHKDDAVWQAVAAYISSRLIYGAGNSLSFSAYSRTGSDISYSLGLEPRTLENAINYHFPVGMTGRGRLGMTSSNTTTGQGQLLETWWQPSTHAKIPDGAVFRILSGTASAMCVFDAVGSLYLLPYDATFPSAYTVHLARLGVDESWNARGCICTNHTGTDPVFLQRWKKGGSTVAEMRKDGELNIKTITTAATYADDAAASAGGIPVGGIYRKSDGSVVWRQV